MTNLIALGFLLISAGAPGTIVGTVKVARAADSSNVVVYVDRVEGKTFPPPKDRVTLDQINLTFVPHVLPVLVGTTVAFPNTDEVRHNVFSPSPSKLFNLGTYSSGVTRAVMFDKPEQ